MISSNPKGWFVRVFHAAIMNASLAFATTAGENWPEFRGPTGQGISTAHHLPTEWSATNNVTWKVAMPGEGWSSPIFYDGRIYLTAAVPNNGGSDQSLRALCLDSTTGKTVWDVEVFAIGITKGHRKNSQASATPLIEGEKLFVHFGHLGTACLDLRG